MVAANISFPSGNMQKFLKIKVLTGRTLWRSVLSPQMMHCCFLDVLTQMILRDGLYPHYDSEILMATDLKYHFTLMDYVVGGGECCRNKTSSTSGAKKPDYFVAHSAGIPVIQGEDKLISNYTKGTSGKDPVLENMDKTPWSIWEDFHGNLALFLGYAALGGTHELTVILGCLVRSTQSFEVIETVNLHNIQDRVKLLRTWIVLIPVVKGIMEGIKQRHSKLSYLVVDRNRTVGGCVVEEMKKEICAIRKVAVFSKSWRFAHDTDATNFCVRLRSVLDILKGRAGFLHEYSSAQENNLHISSEDDCKVACVFAPYCHELPFVLTSAMIIAWIDQLSDRVQHLHSHNIIHNDIRPQNLMLSEKYVEGQPLPTLYLVDYDECRIVPANQKAPGLKVNVNDHAPNISLPHGKEVDIWGVCHILLLWADAMSAGENEAAKVNLREIAASLKADYKATTLAGIREACTTWSVQTSV